MKYPPKLPGRVTVTLTPEMVSIINEYAKRHDTATLGITNNLRLMLSRFARIENLDTNTDARIQARAPRRIENPLSNPRPYNDPQRRS